MEPIIEIRSLSKNYGGFRALNEVSLNIEPGIIFGLLGPNGAGKSTLIKILSCQSRPTSGSVFIDGLDVVKDKKDVASIIGIVPQEHSFYDELTIDENLMYFGSLYGILPVDIKRRSHRVLSLLRLEEKKNSKASDLSGGMKTRLNIACALMHEPRVLILDEPSVGLDPVSRRALWDTIREVKREGTTILITTHYMDEADLLCERIIIMNRGNIIVEGTPDELKNNLGEKIVKITGIPGNYTPLKNRIESAEGVSNCSVNENGVKISVKDGFILQSVIEILEAAGEKITGVESSRLSLEDVFIHFSGEEWH